ncbi:MAG: hypothetical protein ABI876_09790, partial [Bacteroidota bacterium]
DSTLLTGMRLTAFRKDGSVEWSRHYGNSDEHTPTAFARGNGKYFIAGGIAEPGKSHRAEVIATDTQGNILWARSLKFSNGDFSVSAITSTSDGGVVVVGQMVDALPNSLLFIARLDGGGNLRWGYLHTTQEHLASTANDITETTNGFIVCGTVMNSDKFESDALVMRIDGDGKILWANRYEKRANEIAQRIVQTDSGGYAFIGTTNDLFISSAYVVSLDSAGGISWSATLSISTAIEEKGIAISAISGGRLALLTGTNVLNPGDNAVRMTVISNLGDPIFSREYSPEDEKGRYSGWVEPSGDGFFISAREGSPFGGGSMVMIRADENGIGGCNQTPSYERSFMEKSSVRAIPMISTALDSFSVESETTTPIPDAVTILCNGIPPTSSGDEFEWWLSWLEDFHPRSILPANNGMFIAGTGSKIHSPADSGAHYFGLVKLSDSGVPLWGRFLGKEHAKMTGAILTSDGGALLTGYGITFAGGYVMKIDADGNLLWTKKISGLADSTAIFACETADHGFAITVGSCDSINILHGKDAFRITQLDPSGNLIRSTGMLVDTPKTVTAICATSDSGYIVGGYNLIDRTSRFFLTKFDAAGNIIWNRAYESPRAGNARAISITQTSDGYAIAGPFFLFAINDAGLPLWAIVYGRLESATLSSVHPVTSDNGYIFSGGISRPPFADPVPMLLHVDHDGVPQWSDTYPRTIKSQGSNTSAFTDIFQRVDERYVVTGLFHEPTTSPYSLSHIATIGRSGYSMCGTFPLPISAVRDTFSMLPPQPMNVLGGSTTVTDDDKPIFVISIQYHVLCGETSGAPEEITPATELAIQPDPITRGGIAKLMLPIEISGSVGLIISDIGGNEILHRTIDIGNMRSNAAIAIDTRNFFPGMYLLTVKHGGTVLHGKMIVR